MTSFLKELERRGSELACRDLQDSFFCSDLDPRDCGLDQVWAVEMGAGSVCQCDCWLLLMDGFRGSPATETGMEDDSYVWGSW